MGEKVDLPQEEELSFGLFGQSVHLISEYLGGRVEQSGKIISLRGFNFEGYPSSFSLEFSGKRHFLPYPLYDCAELKELKIMNVDLLHDHEINPSKAKILVSVDQAQILCLRRLLENLTLPLSETYRKAAQSYLREVPSAVITDELQYNTVLISQLRALGHEVVDPVIPEICGPFPVSLETLAPIIHELCHTSDDPDIKAAEWIRKTDLAWELERLAKEGADSAEKISGEIRRIEAKEENRVQKNSLRLMGSLFRRFPAADYGRRLKWLDIDFRIAKRESGLLGIEDRGLGGIKH